MAYLLNPNVSVGINTSSIVPTTTKELSQEINEAEPHSNYPPPYRSEYESANIRNNPRTQQNTNTRGQDQGYYVYDPNEGNNASRNTYGGGNNPGNTQQNVNADYQNMEMDGYDEIFVSTFETQAIRNAFIKKVYLILSVQLLCFGGIVALFVFEPNCNKSARMNSMIYYIPSFIIFLVVYFVLVCNSKMRKKVPINFCLLFVMTFGLAMVGATVSAMYDTYIVMMSFAVVAGLCLLITAAAWINIFDMTKYRAYLFVASCLMLLLGIIYMIMSFVIRSEVFSIIYISIMTVLLSAYLMYDTQLIIGGKKHKHELSPEEYILGAVLLYVDIAHLFIYVVMLMGMCRK